MLQAKKRTIPIARSGRGGSSEVDSLKELASFLKAVFHHWATLVTGGVITALLVVWERWRERPVSSHWYEAILLLFLFIACYQAWLDEHRSLSAEQEKNAGPLLKAEIQEIRMLPVYEALPENQQFQCYVLAKVYFVNEASASTTIKDYQMEAEIGGQTQVARRLPSLSGFKFQTKQKQLGSAMVHSGGVVENFPDRYVNVHKDLPDLNAS